jgi:hypothetical protein
MRAENVCIRDTRTDMETDDKIVNVDDNYQDPQLCATIACDIYKHLRASEVCYFSCQHQFNALLLRAVHEVFLNRLHQSLFISFPFNGFRGFIFFCP